MLDFFRHEIVRQHFRFIWVTFFNVKNCAMKKLLIAVSVVAMLSGASAGQPVREWHLFYKEDDNTRDYMDILSIKEIKPNVIIVTTLT